MSRGEVGVLPHAARAGGFRTLRRHPWATAFLISIGWNAGQVLIGLLFYLGVHSSDVPGQVGAFPVRPWSPLDDMYRWDSLWHERIVREGYSGADNGAFWPLLPALVSAIGWLVSPIFGDGRDVHLTIGLLLNIVALAALIVALRGIAARLGIRRGGRTTLNLLLLTAPIAFVLHIYYVEAILMALGAWAYLFAMRRQWALMAACLALATAARLPALLFVAACGLEWLRSKGWWSRRVLSWELLWFVFSLSGFGMFMLLSWGAYGDPLAMMTIPMTNPEWPGNQVTPNIFATLWSTLVEIVQAGFPPAPFVIFERLVPLGSLILLVAMSIYLIVVRKGRGVPLGVMGLLGFLLFTMKATNVGSTHRYAFATFSMLLGLALLLDRHRLRLVTTVICAAGAALQIYGIILWLREYPIVT